MYLEEFMEKLMLLFPDNFRNERNCDEWQRQYVRVLKPSFAVDYQKLWEKVMDEWKLSTTPSPAWIKEKTYECKKPEFIGKMKTIKVVFPWVKNMEYIYDVPLHWTEEDVIKNQMPKKGWIWSDIQKNAVPIVES